jgi:hypothetical protein
VKTIFLPLLLNAPWQKLSAIIWFLGRQIPAKWCITHLNAARVFGKGYIY